MTEAELCPQCGAYWACDCQPPASTIPEEASPQPVDPANGAFFKDALYLTGRNPQDDLAPPPAGS